MEDARTSDSWIGTDNGIEEVRVRTGPIASVAGSEVAATGQYLLHPSTPRLPRPRRGDTETATGPLRVSDASLAASAPTNPAAFAAIYRRYGDALHDFCLGILRDRDAAADCVQDVFCTAATRLGQLRDHDKLRPWLYAIARHEALARLRGRRREQPSQELPDRPSHEQGPETLAAHGELASLVARAAGGLSDRDRTVLELHYRHGLDGPELADALGVSATNANTLVARLRSTVERCLGALLVARHQNDSCAELGELLDGWDGTMTVLLRKRINRHIEHCPECAEARRRLVSPQALLGCAPIMVPAPGWLEDAVVRDVAHLVPAGASGAGASGAGAGAGAGAGGSAAQAGWWPTAIAGGTLGTVSAALPLVAIVAAVIGVPAIVVAIAAGGGAETAPPTAIGASELPVAGVIGPPLAPAGTATSPGTNGLTSPGAVETGARAVPESEARDSAPAVAGAGVAGPEAGQSGQALPDRAGTAAPTDGDGVSRGPAPARDSAATVPPIEPDGDGSAEGPGTTPEGPQEPSQPATTPDRSSLSTELQRLCEPYPWLTAEQCEQSMHEEIDPEWYRGVDGVYTKRPTGRPPTSPSTSSTPGSAGG